MIDPYLELAYKILMTIMLFLIFMCMHNIMEQYKEIKNKQMTVLEILDDANVIKNN